MLARLESQSGPELWFGIIIILTLSTAVYCTVLLLCGVWINFVVLYVFNMFVFIKCFIVVYSAGASIVQKQVTFLYQQVFYHLLIQLCNYIENDIILSFNLLCDLFRLGLHLLETYKYI